MKSKKEGPNAEKIPMFPNIPLVHYYSTEEEFLNIISHGLGFVLSVLGTILLIMKGQHFENKFHFLSFIIYGLSMMILYAASTLYHSAKDPKRRRFLNIIDHSAIYILIAGSYTPFTMITLEGTTGRYLITIIWAFALLGVVLKYFYTGKYDKLSTAIYVLMGWLGIFVIKPLFESLDSAGLTLLLVGGAAYTIGAIFYSFKSLKYNHAIFHVFVLAGSICHFLAIYLFV